SCACRKGEVSSRTKIRQHVLMEILQQPLVFFVRARLFAASAYSAMRVFTSFRTSPAGSGLSGENRIVPVLVEYFFNSARCVRTGCAPGKNELCFAAAPNATNIRPFNRKAGMP